MPFNKGITQSGVTAGGHVAGGNVNHTETHIHAAIPPSQILVDLFNNYDNEDELTQSHDTIIEQLSEYIKYDEVEDALRDLKQKLHEGGRLAFEKEALWLKDSFRRRIEKYRHSPSAQKIFAYLLAAVRVHFQNNIYYEIDGYSDAELGRALLNDVVHVATQVGGRHLAHTSGQSVADVLVIRGKLDLR